MKTIAKTLLEKGVKPTFHRVKIFEYLRNHRTHPDIEEIYKDLLEECPTISKTTIYNTLKMFIDKGLAVCITIKDKMCFDGYIEAHQHFICQKCGNIYDINVSCPYIKMQKIDGHLIKEFCTYFRGICKSCLQKERKKK
ncbi:MAG: Fur family transcriptional regulator [Endomicrobiia bacterium]